ncbi:MAG: hypothetical protein MRY32_01900 [Rickettsiales bacterium]|nr:hypothetical protein [Rickettsiales bacterium]
MILMILIAIALLIAVIANRKGYDFWGWFFKGLMWPFFLINIIAKPSRKEIGIYSGNNEDEIMQGSMSRLEQLTELHKKLEAGEISESEYQRAREEVMHQ